MRLAQIPVAGHLTRDILVVPRHRPIRFPERLAGLLVQRDQILQIHPIHGQDQHALEKHRRGSRATVMAAGQVLPLPQDLVRRGVEAGRAVAPEMDIDPARFDHR